MMIREMEFTSKAKAYMQLPLRKINIQNTKTNRISYIFNKKSIIQLSENKKRKNRW